MLTLSSFALVTLASDIFEVVTAFGASLAVVTFISLILAVSTASSANLAVVTAPLASFAVIIPKSLTTNGLAVVPAPSIVVKSATAPKAVASIQATAPVLSVTKTVLLFPAAILAGVTFASAIFVVVTAVLAIFEVLTAVSIMSVVTIELFKFNFEYAIAALAFTSIFMMVPSAIFVEVIDPSATPAAAFKVST